MSLELTQINYIYEEGTAYERHALKDVNLFIGDHEFIGLIGHTGSGKSTLTQVCNGLIRPTSGQVRFDGEDIYEKGYNRVYLRSRVGLVFQYPEHQLFEESVLKDVCFGPKNLGLKEDEQKERAEKALQLVGLDESFYGNSPFELSGGQKRRVAIAGVIAMKPDILILDEPTAGLDPRGRDEILNMIADMYAREKMTIILVSHSMEDVARYVNRLLVMNDGELFCDDTPAKVFARYKELEAIGLAAPQITYILNDLHARGIPVDPTATTITEGRDSLLRALRSR